MSTLRTTGGRIKNTRMKRQESSLLCAKELSKILLRVLILRI